MSDVGIKSSVTIILHLFLLELVIIARIKGVGRHTEPHRNTLAEHTLIFLFYMGMAKVAVGNVDEAGVNSSRQCWPARL